jgi:hypothetical protein
MGSRETVYSRCWRPEEACSACSARCSSLVGRIRAVPRIGGESASPRSVHSAMRAHDCLRILLTLPSVAALLITRRSPATWIAALRRPRCTRRLERVEASLEGMRAQPWSQGADHRRAVHLPDLPAGGSCARHERSRSAVFCWLMRGSITPWTVAAARDALVPDIRETGDTSALWRRSLS